MGARQDVEHAATPGEQPPRALQRRDGVVEVGAAGSPAIASISARCSASAASKAGAKCSGLICVERRRAERRRSSRQAADLRRFARSSGLNSPSVSPPCSASNQPANAGLIPPRRFVFIARHARRNQQSARPRRINWINVSTVLSAAILIAAEVFGAAFAGGWAFGNLFGARRATAPTSCRSLFFVAGIAVMVAFIRNAHAHRAVHHAQAESPRASRARLNNSLTIFRAAREKTACIMRANTLCRALPNFARACGRVSVGRHPDKRPDSRLRKRSALLNHCDRQPEAKPAHPALNGGRGLKQRRSGLFWSRRPSKGRTPKRLVHLCRPCGTGSPAPIQGSTSAW